MKSRKDKVYVTILTMFHMEEDVLGVGGARAPGNKKGGKAGKQQREFEGGQGWRS